MNVPTLESISGAGLFILLYPVILAGTSSLIARGVYRGYHAETKFLYIWWLGLFAAGLIPMVYIYRLMPRPLFFYTLGWAGLVGIPFYLFILYNPKYKKGLPEIILNSITSVATSFYSAVFFDDFLLGAFFPGAVERFPAHPLLVKITATVASALVLLAVCFPLKLLIIIQKNLRPDIKKLEANRKIKSLINALGYRKDPRVPSEASAALAKLGQAAVVPLIKNLRGNVYLRAARAAEVLGTLKDPRAIQPLIDCLKFGEDYLGGASIAALAKIGAKAVEPVIKALKDPKSRYRAIEVLGELADPRAVDPLAGFFNDPDPVIRKKAAQAMFKMDHPRAASLLLTNLKSWHPGSLRGLKDDLKNFFKSLKNPELTDFLESLLTRIDLTGDFTLEGRCFIEICEGLIWNPVANEAGAIYWIISGKWDACLQSGRAAVAPLLAVLQHQDQSFRREAARILNRLNYSGQSR